MVFPSRTPTLPTGTIYWTRRLPDVARQRLEAAGASVVCVERPDEDLPSRGELLTQVGRCAVLMPMLSERIDRQVLAAGPGLRGVAQMAVGHDNLDVAAATELGIPVSNTPGVLNETTADLTWALLLAVARRIPAADTAVRRDGEVLWGPDLLVGRDVGPGPEGRRKVLGVVGYGGIGRAVARRSLGFDMELLVADPRHRDRVEADGWGRWADLETVLAASDFLCLHVPLRPETHHLIDTQALARMKPTAYLINVARGPVIDESALVEVLRKGRLAGAALDVFEDEPAVHPDLLGLPNVVLAPHIGSASRDTRDAMAHAAAANALAHWRGEPAPNVLNPEVYDTEAYRRRSGR